MIFVSRNDIRLLVDELSYLISEYEDSAKESQGERLGYCRGCIGAYSVCRALMKELISDEA